MRQYILLVAISATLLTSCSFGSSKTEQAVNTSAQKAAEVQKASETQKIATTGSGEQTPIPTKSLKPLTEKEQMIITEYTNIVKTNEEGCDSKEYLQKAEAYLKELGTKTEIIQATMKTAAERCRIRAILQDNKECSILSDAQEKARCEYVKTIATAFKTEKVTMLKDASKEGLEKMAIYARVYGFDNRVALPELFASWDILSLMRTASK